MADLEIFFFLLGDSSPFNDMFPIIVSPGTSVGELKKLVYAQKQNGLKGIDASDLRLWKLKTPIPGNEAETDGGVAALGPKGEKLSEFALPMGTPKKLEFYFPSAMIEEYIHVIVQAPNSEPPDELGPRTKSVREDGATSKRMQKNKRIMDPDSEPETLPNSKRRRLTKLPESDTILMTVGDEDNPDAPVLIPTCGAGFRAFTEDPNIIVADKTSYIEELDKEPRYQYLFLRPRRFGKSTFLQTLSRYYDKAKAEQFEDTFRDFYIGSHRTAAASSLLVLCFDFSAIPVLDTMDQMRARFRSHIYSTLSGFLLTNSQLLQPFDLKELLDETDGVKSLENVLKLVRTRNEELFVGVDEYDAPSNSALFSSELGLYDRVAEFFKTHFFAIIKGAVSEGVVMKYWLTGVLPAFRDGISPLTAVNIISDKPKYHGLCGLTEVEVEAITKAYLGPESTAEDISKATDTLRRWYNGYRFSSSTPSSGLNSLYNPQLVFTHLRHLRDDKGDKHGFQPKDEIEAIHTATVLNAIPNDGNTSFKNIFLRVASGSLHSEIRHQFSALEFHQRDSNPWLTQTLLYFFGVFTYDKNMECLTIPNMTMKILIKNRLFQHANIASPSLADRVEQAYSHLLRDKPGALTALLEEYFRLSATRAVKGLNEAGFRTVIEMLWFKPGFRACLSELCLLANPRAQPGHGRFAFADIFFPDSSHPVLLELKNASLEGLWRGRTGKEQNSDAELELLREELKTAGEGFLLNLKVSYRQLEDGTWRWATKTIRQLKEEGFTQAKRYIATLKQTPNEQTAEGVCDSRILRAAGKCSLTAYVVICVGGTRVLGWKVTAENVSCTFVGSIPDQ